MNLKRKENKVPRIRKKLSSKAKKIIVLTSFCVLFPSPFPKKPPEAVRQMPGDKKR